AASLRRYLPPFPTRRSSDLVTRSPVIMRLSMLPAFTPMRRAVPWSAAALAMSFTWSSKRRMLPGFTRTPAQPASIAAKTYLGWKWMSAITGIGDFAAIAGSASASSWRGHATRTMSQPAAVSSAICCSVALMSCVGVVVIDCTVIGASPPTWMSPSLTLRVFRRGASTGGGCLTDGIPRLTEVTSPLWTCGPGVARRGETPPPLLHDPGGTRHARSGEQGDGLDDVRVQQQQGHRDEHQRHRVGQRQHPGHV